MAFDNPQQPERPQRPDPSEEMRMARLNELASNTMQSRLGSLMMTVVNLEAQIQVLQEENERLKAASKKEAK
jgi:uncharacterized small protein (DUF1192 family)